MSAKSGLRVAAGVVAMGIRFVVAVALLGCLAFASAQQDTGVGGGWAFGMYC